jgi:formate hydrogenlyase transcriptional activator
VGVNDVAFNHAMKESPRLGPDTSWSVTPQIVGNSLAIRRVLEKVSLVADTDSTVLIYGETGTGKELVARALHAHSARRERPFIKLNCAAIPCGLLESELFGHEKGAFTGALLSKDGRFQLADGGTILLDEIGDLPLELQPKLLRVLQEQEFERVGGTRTVRVNVRIIAATNRDLSKMLAEQHFRSDLFYRLNVIPLVVPPLRERREDIPILVRHFARKYAERSKRRIRTIEEHVMAMLVDHSWPGNVRELENVIERAVILSRDEELRVSFTDLLARPSSVLLTLAEVERQHIVLALQEAMWIIGGPDGAAAKLGLKRTSLQYKMQRLGIVNERKRRSSKDSGLSRRSLVSLVPTPSEATTSLAEMHPFERPLSNYDNAPWNEGQVKVRSTLSRTTGQKILNGFSS